MGNVRLTTSLKMRIIISFLLVSIIPTLIVSWLLFTQASFYLKENLFSYLKGFSEMKKRTLVMEVDNRKYQIETAAQSLRVLNLLSSLYNGVGKDAFIGELRECLRNILGEGTDFEEIYIIDTAGKILVSTEKGNEGKSVKDREYFEQGSIKTYFQDFFLSSVTGRSSLVVASPIKKQNGTLLGVLAGRINLDEFYKIISDVSGLGSSGESCIGNKGDGEAVILTPTRNDPNSALNVKIKFGDDIGTPMQQAVHGNEGEGLAKDYRGKMVMASWKYIPDVKWGIVTKMDQEEFEKPMAKWRWYVLLVSFDIIIIVGVVAYIFAVTIVKPINLLTNAAERISKGETGIKIDTSAKDEIGNLARSFERMLAAIKIFMENKE